MIEDKAREIAAQANLIWADACGGPDHATISARLGILAGLEMAARVADDHAFNAWHIADQLGQNSACASGRNYGGRAIAQSIRALGSQQS